ncbi:MAG: sulfotransferase [Cyanobacteria bacterium REEB446]|nr:sulfotransferase [Cyanobacteria bacterium REEB446]
MNESFKKLVFVVGCPRSGTTKLTELLNSHPEIFGSSETHFFNINWGFSFLNNSSIDLLKDISEENLHHSLKDFYEHYRIKDFLQLADINSFRITQLCKVLLENAELGVREQSPETFKQILFTALLQASKEKMPNKTIFCEKTPQHLQNVQEIHKLFPSAKFIHVKRDGRDVVNSLLKMPWRPAGLINNARFWRKYARLGEKLENNLLDEKLKKNIISIKFEELLENPPEVLKRICKFMDINFDESMLEQAHNNSQKVFADWEKQWKHKANSSIDPNRKGAYKKELSQDEQIILNHFLQKDLTALGYEVDLSNFKFKHLIYICSSYIGLFKARLLRFISQEQ